MNKQVRELIIYIPLIITGIVLLIFGLIKAGNFLIPFATAALLAMILLPVVGKLTDWGVSRGLAVLLSDLLLLGLCIGLFFIVASQIQNITADWPKYKEKLQPKIEKVENYVEKKTGLNQQQQEKKLQEALQSNGSNGKKIVTGFTSFLGNFLLVFIYVFFFLFYKTKFKKSILNFVPEENRKKASSILQNFSKVSQQYLFGRFLLILFLTLIYSAGLALVGIKHAIFISIIAAVLSLIPYIGNIIGLGLALAMSLLTNGALMSLIGVIIVYSIAQFVESYILEPYVVGHQVELNPVLTLIGVIAGGFIWGIVGMIIAIPVMGILKVVFDSIPVLNPLGYVLDEEDTGSGGGWLNKMKDKVVSMFKK